LNVTINAKWSVLSGSTQVRSPGTLHRTLNIKTDLFWKVNKVTKAKPEVLESVKVS